MDEYSDRDLEKLAMLWSIEEGVYGLYQLFEIINPYTLLTLSEKYSLIYGLLRELLLENLAVLEEFTDSQLSTKVRDVDLSEILPILDNPRSWDLNTRPSYSVRLTLSGEEFMDKYPNRLKELERLRRI